VQAGNLFMAWASAPVEVVADATHGQIMRVTLSAAGAPARQRLQAGVHQRLDPLTRDTGWCSAGKGGCRSAAKAKAQTVLVTTAFGWLPARGARAVYRTRMSLLCRADGAQHAAPQVHPYGAHPC
jgi:hypothetical protein